MQKNLTDLVIHWLTSDRFDSKPDKSSWTEVGHSLATQGALVNIVTSFAKTPYKPKNLLVNMVYLRALNLPLVYRVAFTVSAFIWLIRNAQRNDLIILNQHELWILPLLKIARFKRIHLDIRTLPVIENTLKNKLDVFLFWKLVMKLFAKHCNGYSFITDRLLKVVEAEFSLKFTHSVIWQSGVNLSFFSNAIRASKASDEHSAPFTLFYHGSLYERRGVDRVIEAFARLPSDILNQSRLVIVGSGVGLPALKKLISTLHLDEIVELRGFIPYELIPQQIAEADVCICPLPDYPEWIVSSPLKVLEYMACAKPMILTPIPAHQDVLKGSKFVIWTKGDRVNQFADAIEVAFKTRIELKNEALAGPNIILKNWDWNSHGVKLAKYFEQQYQLNTENEIQSSSLM